MGQYRSMTQTGQVGIESDGFYCWISCLLGYLEGGEGCRVWFEQ